MIIRKISIGRSPYSDISLDSRHVYASQYHGEIYSDGNQMVYCDMSRNGTMINRTMVKHRAIPIKRGDIILVAGCYLLDWNRIDFFFPGKPNNVSDFSPYISTNKSFRVNPNQWNWGAMGVYPLWGITNGCWWTMPLFFLIGILFPLPNLFFGLYGTRLALKSKYWKSTEDFLQEQIRWKWTGVAVMISLSLLFIWWIGAYALYLFNR